MKDIVIRKAVRNDCQRLMELVKGLAEYEKAPQEVTVSFAHFEESGFGSSPVWWAFVAEKEDVICGFALWYVRYSTWKGQRLYLEDLYVEPDMRGKGVGGMLFDVVLAEAKEKNFSGMMWQVLNWNKPAIGFYEKCSAKLDSEWINCSLDF